MKKCALFLLLALLIFGLLGCAQDKTIYERTVNGKTYVINREENTVTCDGVVCRYSILGVKVGNFYSGQLTIMYPNGSWYARDIDSNGYLVLGSEETSDDYSDSIYPRGEDLCFVMEEFTLSAANSNGKTTTQNGRIVKILVGLVVICMGAVNLFFPGLFFSLKYALWVQNAEPTDFALGMSRIGGVILIIMGVVFMFL